MYSLPAHKEFRFLLPALLLLMPYCGVALHDLNQRWGCPSATADPLLHQVNRRGDLIMAHSLLSKTMADRCLSMMHFMVHQMHVDIQTDNHVPKAAWYMQAHPLSVHATLSPVLLLLHCFFFRCFFCFCYILLLSPVHMLVMRHSW